MTQMAFAAVSAFAQVRSGQAQEQAYKARAQDEEIAAKSESLKFKKQAVQQLVKMQEVIAATVARAAAGGVNALSGSALNLQNYAAKKGREDFVTAIDSSLVSQSMGDYQADNYRRAGKRAKQTAYLSAFATLGQGYVKQQDLEYGDTATTGIG